MELEVPTTTTTDFFAPHFCVDETRWYVHDAVWEQNDDGEMLRQLGWMYRHAQSGLPLRVVWWRREDEEEFELDYFPDPQKIRAMDASLDELVPERLEWLLVPQAHAACVVALLAQIDRDYTASTRCMGAVPDAVETIEVEGAQELLVEGDDASQQQQMVIELDGERIQFAYNLFMQALQQNYFVEPRKVVKAKRTGET